MAFGARRTFQNGNGSGSVNRFWKTYMGLAETWKTVQTAQKAGAGIAMNMDMAHWCHVGSPEL
jgi:hypothetical protein